MGSFQAYGWDMAEDWKSGELWKLKRVNNIREGVFSRNVDEKTTQLLSKDDISFGTMTANEVLLVWKEEASDPENADAENGLPPGGTKKPAGYGGKRGT